MRSLNFCFELTESTTQSFKVAEFTNSALLSSENLEFSTRIYHEPPHLIFDLINARLLRILSFQNISHSKNLMYENQSQDETT